MITTMMPVRTVSAQVGHTTLAAEEIAKLLPGATVVKADIAASNGVIHAIDTVMLPTSAAQAAVQAPAEVEEGSSDEK